MNNRFIKTLTIILVTIFLVKCSSLSTTYKFKNEYMPLTAGNKWYYSFLNSRNNDDIVLVKEVVSIDTIEGKEYAVIQDLFVRKINDTIKNYSYLRISNDTLYKMYFYEEKNRYFENADAIFSLKLNEETRVQLEVDTTEERSEDGIFNLPVIDWMNMKVIKKAADTIEFYKNTKMIDSEHKVTYKKGVGIIETKGSMSVGYKLRDYKLVD